MVAAALTVEELLSAWDRAAAADPVTRALVLRTAGDPDRDPETAADEPVGARDRALLELLLATFGPTAACVVDCPRCSAVGELDLDVRRVLASVDAASRDDRDPDDRDPDDGGGGDRDRGVVEVDGWSVAFRLPTSQDLRAVGDPSDGASVVSALRSRLLTAVDPPAPQDADDLPPGLWPSVEEAMAALDPLGDLRLATTCHACGAAIDALLDPAAFLWRRVDVAVRALLAEVDLLARAYGWSEPEVLALAPARRRHYVERVTS